MPMELDVLVEEIKGFGDKKALIEKLKDIKTVYQPIFNDGHAVATAQLSDEKKEVDKKLQESETKLTDLQTEFDTYKASKPDTATLDKQWSDKLAAVKDEFKEYKKQVKQEKIDAQRDTALSKVHTLLAVDVDPEYAESLVQRASIKNRITVDESGNLRILQPEQSIPYAGDVDAQIKALASELVENVKPIFRRTAIEGGPGKTDITGQTQPKGKQKYDQIREQVKKSAGTGGVAPADALDRAFGKVKA